MTVVIGRDAELARLRRLRETTGPQRILVVGPPGIGKSTLLEHAVFAARNGPATIVQYAASEAEEGLPYAALHAIWHALDGEVATLTDEHAAVLRTACDLGTEGRVTNPWSVGVALLNLLGAAAAGNPLLIVLDDLQWLDRDSAQAISFAARRLLRESVAIIGASRAGAAANPFAGFERIDLEPLGEELAATVLRSHPDGAALPEAVARQVLRAAGGVPLALVELPRLLRPDERVGLDDVPDPPRVGSVLETAYGSRVVELGEKCRRALVVVAAGGRCRLDTLESALGRIGGNLADIDPAEATGLVGLQEGEIHFTHPLARSAVYHGASAAARRSAHAALAAALSPHDDPLRHALHVAEAATGPSSEVADALDAAACIAQQRGAASAGPQMMARAARLTPDRSRRLHRLMVAARWASTSGLEVQLPRLLELAADHAMDPATHADVVRLRARHLYLTGSSNESLRILESGALAVERVDPERAAMMLVDATSRGDRARRPQGSSSARAARVRGGRQHLGDRTAHHPRRRCGEGARR